MLNRDPAKHHHPGAQPGDVRADPRHAAQGLNDAVADALIPANPARAARVAPHRRARPRLWTVDRVRRWHDTGNRPSPVMVWTAAQTGAFLDAAATAVRELSPLLHLMAYCGLRRGEAVGLLDADADLTHQRLFITHQITILGWTPHSKAPKSPTGDRTIELDTATTALLRAYRHTRPTAVKGPAPGLFFVQDNGQPWHPGVVSRRFRHLVAATGLPPVRLHDLRHGAATLAHAAGADLKDIQALLGHSSINLTADTYTTLPPQRARATAEAIAATIPRQTNHTTNW